MDSKSPVISSVWSNARHATQRGSEEVDACYDACYKDRRLDRVLDDLGNESETLQEPNEDLQRAESEADGCDPDKHPTGFCGPRRIS